MSKTITKVALGVASNSNQTLIKGLSLESQGGGVGSGHLITGTAEGSTRNRVLLKVETNYGMAEEYVMLESKLPNPPAVTPEDVAKMSQALSQFKAGNSDLDIDLTQYVTNSSPTADYSIRDVTYTVAESTPLPDFLTLSKSGKLSVTPGYVTEAGTYSANIEVSTNQGKVKFPVSFTLQHEKPSNLVVWNRTYWRTTGGTSYLKLKILAGNTDYHAKWTPNTKSAKYLKAVGAQNGGVYLQTYIRRIWPAGEARFGIVPKSEDTPNYIPLPGELGDVLGREVLLYPIPGITNSPATSAYLYLSTQVQRAIRIYHSPIISQYCTASVNYPFSTEYNSVGTARVFLYPGYTYGRLNLSLDIFAADRYGYDSKTAKKINKYYRYRNHIWLALPPDTKGTGSEDWVLVPIEVLVPQYGKTSGTSIYQAPDYDWGGGSICPNHTGGEIIVS